MRWHSVSHGAAELLLVGPDYDRSRMRKGSHAIIAQEPPPYGEACTAVRDLSANGCGSEACEDETALRAYLGAVPGPCRPASAGRRPRFKARGEFDPALPPSPVQVAIRQARGMAAR